MKFRLFVFALILLLGTLPVQAQERVTNTVSFNGFRFSFDSSLAANVNITSYPGDPVDYQAPGGPEVKHTQFLLYNQPPAPESLLDGVGAIRVYRTADFAGYAEHEARLQQLQTLLDQRPDLSAYYAIDDNMAENTLPFLPVFPAAQVIRARAQYVETGAVRGISYVTVYRQGPAPFVADEFLYTFQGISADGQFYISAIFRLNATMFPAQMPEVDPQAFIDSIQTYFAESVTLLNEAAPDAFLPALPVLDAVIQSFAFEV